MNKNQVIIMLIVGVFLFTGMLIPNFAHAHSLPDDNITAEPYVEETQDADATNHVPINKNSVYSLSDTIPETTAPEEPIQITTEPTEIIKETTPTSTEPAPTEAPKAEIRENTPNAPKAPKETKLAKEAIPAPTNPAPTEPQPIEPQPTEPEATVPETTEPIQETEPQQEDIVVEEEPIKPEQTENSVNNSIVDLEDSRNDDFGDCPKCGRKLWTYWDQTGCFTFLVDSTCDCGTFVKAGQCHHH